MPGDEDNLQALQSRIDQCERELQRFHSIVAAVVALLGFVGICILFPPLGIFVSAVVVTLLIPFAIVVSLLLFMYTVIGACNRLFGGKERTASIAAKRSKSQ